MVFASWRNGFEEEEEHTGNLSRKLQAALSLSLSLSFSLLNTAKQAATIVPPHDGYKMVATCLRHKREENFLFFFLENARREGRILFFFFLQSAESLCLFFFFGWSSSSSSSSCMYARARLFPFRGTAVWIVGCYNKPGNGRHSAYGSAAQMCVINRCPS